MFLHLASSPSPISPPLPPAVFDAVASQQSRRKVPQGFIHLRRGLAVTSARRFHTCLLHVWINVASDTFVKEWGSFCTFRGL